MAERAQLQNSSAVLAVDYLDYEMLVRDRSGQVAFTRGKRRASERDAGIARPPPSTRLCCSARLLNRLNTAGSFPVNGANGTEFSASLYYPRISGRGNRNNREIFGGAGLRLVKESLLAIATAGSSITSSRAPHIASKHLTSQALHIATLFARRHPAAQ